jgi:hypothetical protein
MLLLYDIICPHSSSSTSGISDRLIYPLSSSSDFGFLYCSAENVIGTTAGPEKGGGTRAAGSKKDERCVFQIRRKGKGNKVC